MTKTAMPPLPAVTFDVGDQVEVATFFWRELRRRHGTIVGAEGEIWFFNGKCWEAFKTHELRTLLHSYSGMLAGPVSSPYRLHVGAGFINGVLDCLADKVEDPEFFEETAPGVCCQNGFVSISDDGTAKLVPHSPKQRHRFVMGGSWEPGKRPTGKLLETLLDGCFKDDPEAEEKKRCLRQLAGCVIMGRGTKLASPKAFVLHGPGADNGKSQFLEMLKALVPPDASAALSMDGLCNPYFTFFCGQAALPEERKSDSRGVSMYVITSHELSIGRCAVRHSAGLFGKPRRFTVAWNAAHPSSSAHLAGHASSCSHDCRNAPLAAFGSAAWLGKNGGHRWRATRMAARPGEHPKLIIISSADRTD